MAISGYPGLYRFISQGRNAIIVESLADKKRMSVYSTSKISTLEEIAVYTDSEELPLSDVFKRIYHHAGGKEILNHKSSNEEIKKFFEEVLPEYDRERVYVSDMKKIVHWYNLLVKYDMINPDEEEEAGRDSNNDTGESDKMDNPDKAGSSGAGNRSTAGNTPDA